MNREHLGVNNTFSVPVAQDVLNPNLKNTTSRIIVLDSQYRQSAAPTETATDYTLDLSEPLLNVLSLRLYSFSIPYTWYTIDTMYGNTCFWLTFNDAQNFPITSVKISLEPGNYSTATIVEALMDAIDNAGITWVDITHESVIYNQNNGKITLDLWGGVYQGLIIDNTTVITLFDAGADLSCNSVCAMSIAINQTLGWVLGFRVPVMNVYEDGNTAIAIPELYGPKYFILVIMEIYIYHMIQVLIGELIVT
jgi:hypothetical protein